MASMAATDLGSDYIRHEHLHEYTWILALDVIFAFFAAYGIGANDVANAFGTSVASRALTMRQALAIAAVFEFVGAFFLGAEVTGTISGGIAKASFYVRDPELLMFGMMCVDLGVAIWLWVATYMELPVSTSHSVVGAVIGMSLVLKGGYSIYWYRDIPDFPYIGGVVAIVVSWLTSPILSAMAAALIFWLARTFCLRSTHPFERSLIVLPIVVSITVAINMMLLITKAGKNYGGDDFPNWEVQTISWACGAFMFFATLALMPSLKKKVLREKEMRAQAESAMADVAEADAAADAAAAKEPEHGSEEEAEVPLSFWQNIKKNTIDRDVHEEVKHIEVVTEIHNHAEVFDEDAEECFKYLQVFTACCNSLAHGANDVANAIGPLAAVAQIWQTGTFSNSASVKKWVLAVGGVGIVVGLATYGYNIIRAIGLKLSRITSSRGFSIELGSAMVVVVASNYGLPISTTHCLVGATVGVGALEGTAGVNWLLFLKMIIGWLMTLIVAGGITAAFVAVGAYAPSAQMAEQIRHYEDGLRLRTTAFQYAFDWEATAALADPASVIAPTYNATSGVFSFRVVPDHSPNGVPNDKSFMQWSSEYWKDAGVWQKSAYWQKAWAQAVGYNAPDWPGQNSSTIRDRDAFALFDKVTQFAFSPNQQAELQQILSGEKVLCCDEVYKCCPRTCKYKLVNDDCTAKSKCVLKKEDPDCVDDPCDEPINGSVGAASNCKIVDTADDCPMTMDINSPKNYIGPNYVSFPITGPPEGTNNQTYGKAYTDWREPDYNLETMHCPAKF